MALTAEWAAATAEELLAPLGRRWTHVRAVAAVADRLGPALEEDHQTLVVAAYLHDIGYAPSLAIEGFHPLDGARFVRDQGDERVASLVAHHTGARIEAQFRGYHDYETEFPFAESVMHAALTYCDTTTGPDGSRVSVQYRVAEVQTRYGADHVTARAMIAGLPEFLSARRQIDQLAAAANLLWRRYPPSG